MSFFVFRTRSILGAIANDCEQEFRNAGILPRTIQTPPMIPWLDTHNDFPPTECALRDPNGLLCAGADLSPQRLLAAYRRGIFPWFSAGEPILWWSPDPRMTLVPAQFACARSLRKTLSRGDYEVRLDTAFADVIQACASVPRKGQHGTWITPGIQAAYERLHTMGVAHSVETWIEGRLVGGLYGLAIGRMFYGESMFSNATDASKIAIAHLTRYLDRQGYGLIDCQMSTPHLASLGAREISRSDFLNQVSRLTAIDVPPERWPADAARTDWK